jgi:hypothetical protein
LGSLSDAGGSIHTGYIPSPVGTSNPPFTSSFSASGITVERDHGIGSSTRIGWGGAMGSERGKLRQRRNRKGC